MIPCQEMHMRSQSHLMQRRNLERKWYYPQSLFLSSPPDHPPFFFWIRIG